MQGLRAYQRASRLIDAYERPVYSQCGAARLLRIGDALESGHAAVILIPSLINPPHILDMGREMSLARYLEARGHDPWLVDWGTPAPEEREMDLGNHITQRLLPLLDALDQPFILVGYCLGGTIALAAAQHKAPAAVVTIAAPWRFDRYTDEDRAVIAKLWADAQPLCERLGYVPMEILQSGFWALDTARTVRKYAAFADMEAGSEGAIAFMAVEDWANDGPPLTYAAARELFEDLYAANHTGDARWTVGGRAIDLAALTCPSLSIRSATDRIVPASASPLLRDNHETALGHVGMIVSRRAPAMIWLRLSQWLSDNGG